MEVNDFFRIDEERFLYHNTKAEKFIQDIKMKKFIQMIFLACLFATQSYGASQVPPFYRVNYEQEGRNRHLFIIGTAHGLTMGAFPEVVLRYIDQANFLVSELGLNYWKKDPTDYIKVLRSQTPVEKCLKSDGTYFSSEDKKGWLSLVSDPKKRRRIEAELPKYFSSPKLVKYLYQISPEEVASYLFAENLRRHYPQDNAPRDTGMDGALSKLFEKQRKNVFALESYSSRLDSFNRYYKENHYHDEFYGRSLEGSVQKIDYLINADPRMISAALEEVHHSLKDIMKEYYENKSSDFPEDLWTNYRNQQWIEQSWKKIFSHPGVGLIAVGQAHLDMGCVPSIGKTGLLNFFQALKESGKTWSGIQVKSIERLIRERHSAVATKRPQYKWVQEEGISTEGTYFKTLMGRL